MQEVHYRQFRVNRSLSLDDGGWVAVAGGGDGEVGRWGGWGCGGCRDGDRDGGWGVGGGCSNYRQFVGCVSSLKHRFAGSKLSSIL